MYLQTISNTIKQCQKGSARPFLKQNWHVQLVARSLWYQGWVLGIARVGVLGDVHAMYIKRVTPSAHVPQERGYCR